MTGWTMLPIDRRRFCRSVVGATTLGGLATGTASPVHQTWTADLEPVEGTGSRAHGEFEMKFVPDGPGGTDDRMSFGLEAGALSSDVFAAHIHHDGPLGTIIVTLFPAKTERSHQRGRSFVADGRFDAGDVDPGDAVGDVDDLSDLMREIEAGNEFVRVHTVDHPPGELVGQIE